MSLTLYGLKSCDTCKKALKTLESAGATVSFIDIRAEADLAKLVPAWVESAGANMLINTRSTTWRGLDADTRARAEDDPAGVLIENPTLIKRPVIVAGDAVHVGWTQDVQASLT